MFHFKPSCTFGQTPQIPYHKFDPPTLHLIVGIFINLQAYLVHRTITHKDLDLWISPQASFIRKALFWSCNLCKPTPPSCLGLHISSLAKRWTFYYSFIPNHIKSQLLFLMDLHTAIGILFICMAYYNIAKTIAFNKLYGQPRIAFSLAMNLASRLLCPTKSQRTP